MSPSPLCGGRCPRSGRKGGSYDNAGRISGKKIVIRNNWRALHHSRYCVLGRPDVFKPNVDGRGSDPDALRPTIATQVRLLSVGCIDV